MPTALVLSAGGMFAAWEIGVWKVLSRYFKPDLVVGSSAGALNGWAIAGGASAEQLERDWLDPSTAAMMTFGPHRYGLLRPDALYAKAQSLCAEYSPRTPFALTLVEVPRFTVRLVRDRAITWRHLAAGCAVPLGFPPVSINGIRYVDGGLLTSLPLWAAEELGATRAIAVNCLTSAPFRLLRTVLGPRRPSPYLDVLRIEPSSCLGSLRDAIVWDAFHIEKWIALGERDANRALTSGKM